MTNTKPPHKVRRWWIEFSGDPTRDKIKAFRYVSGEKVESFFPGEEVIEVIESRALDEALAKLAYTEKLLGEAMGALILASESLGDCSPHPNSMAYRALMSIRETLSKIKEGRG